MTCCCRRLIIPCCVDLVVQLLYVCICTYLYVYVCKWYVPAHVHLSLTFWCQNRCRRGLGRAFRICSSDRSWISRANLARITIWGRFWTDLGTKMGPLRLICAWFAREIHDRASKVQFWQILGRFWSPKSIENRSEIVICAWLAREIHELPELLIFWSILEAILMKFWWQKRAWNEIRKDVKQVKALIVNYVILLENWQVF